MNDKRKRPSLNIKGFALALLLVLLSAPYIIYEATIKPLSSRLISSRQTLNVLQEEKKILLELKSMTRKLEMETAALEKMISDLEYKNGLKDNRGNKFTINRILDTLKTSNKRLSVKLSGISVKPYIQNSRDTANKNSVKTINISFVSGYNDSIRYIDDISNMPYPILVRGVTMRRENWKTESASHAAGKAKEEPILTEMELIVYL